MAIPKLMDDLAVISKLGDNPGTDNNLTSEQLRERFDEASLIIQRYINNVLVPSFDASADPAGGLTMRGEINMNGQRLFGIGNPENASDATPKSYVDDVKEIAQNAQKKQRVYRATLSASGWEDGVETCSQYLSVNGLTTTDTFFLDIDLANIASGDDMAALNEAWGGIYRAQCASDGYLFVEFSLSEKPSIDIPVKVVAFEV